MKIAIYSGAIPSTTFIENLIESVACHHDVYLFGTKKKSISYSSNHIQVIETPTISWLNILLTIKRVLLLGFKNPKLVLVAYREAKTYNVLYEQWMRFSRFIPVLLYQPDIFHLQWASEINRWMFLRKAIGCKILVSLRGSNINYLPQKTQEIADRYRHYFPEVDAFHAVSDAIKQEAQLYGASGGRIVKIHSIVSPSLPKAFTFRSLESSPLHILSIGRYNELKGYRFALEAIQLLCTKGVDCHYTIIAKGKPEQALLDLRAALNLEALVIFDDCYYDQKALFDKMTAYQVLLLPSLSEGIANVVLEAMLLGIPVVSTNCGGMPEVVKPQKTGWLVPMNDPEAIAGAIIDILNTPEKEIKRITEQAFNFVNTHFDSKSILEQFLSLYENLKLNGQKSDGDS